MALNSFTARSLVAPLAYFHVFVSRSRGRLEGFHVSCRQNWKWRSQLEGIVAAMRKNPAAQKRGIHLFKASKMNGQVLIYNIHLFEARQWNIPGRCFLVGSFSLWVLVNRIFFLKAKICNGFTVHYIKRQNGMLNTSSIQIPIIHISEQLTAFLKHSTSIFPTPKKPPFSPPHPLFNQLGLPDSNPTNQVGTYTLKKTPLPYPFSHSNPNQAHPSIHGNTPLHLATLPQLPITTLGCQGSA